MHLSIFQRLLTAYIQHRPNLLFYALVKKGVGEPVWKFHKGHSVNIQKS